LLLGFLFNPLMEAELSAIMSVNWLHSIISQKTVHFMLHISCITTPSLTF
jgi:hypothetical protein